MAISADNLAVCAAQDGAVWSDLANNSVALRAFADELGNLSCLTIAAIKEERRNVCYWD